MGNWAPLRCTPLQIPLPRPTAEALKASAATSVHHQARSPALSPSLILPNLLAGINGELLQFNFSRADGGRRRDRAVPRARG